MISLRSRKVVRGVYWLPVQNPKRKAKFMGRSTSRVLQQRNISGEHTPPLLWGMRAFAAWLIRSRMNRSYEGFETAGAKAESVKDGTAALSTAAAAAAV
jgi:hypothetical protein